jgi:NHL repeat
VVASGFAEGTDPAALVIGPTGVAVGRNGVLYVADSVNNRIAAVPDALGRDDTFGVPGGITVSKASVLNGPLGMTLAPNGDVLTVNGNTGLVVETAPWGQTVATATLDDSGAPRVVPVTCSAWPSCPGSAAYGSSTTGPTRSTSFLSTPDPLGEGRVPALPHPVTSLRDVGRPDRQRLPLTSSRTCGASPEHRSRARRNGRPRSPHVPTRR